MPVRFSPTPGTGVTFVFFCFTFVEPVKESIKTPKFQLASAERYATQIQYDTDEQSLAEYIGGLSSMSDTTPRSPKHKVLTGTCVILIALTINLIS